ncbi:hypothetical protein SS50377_20774 [Spironucleus salmonicida]|uniref:Uncharacterized protein n=1 Tax=Spironucleus salmonicida TaxID=348837 RepID=A0A9P8LZZ7_9EUKA|nr:hypothetical protein SS50377_20774 [Spironucleus salmonicida]
MKPIKKGINRLSKKKLQQQSSPLLEHCNQISMMQFHNFSFVESDESLANFGIKTLFNGDEQESDSENNFLIYTIQTEKQNL